MKDPTVIIALLLILLQTSSINGQLYDICSATTVSDASGVITSPNYPLHYGNSLSCSITISAAAGKVIKIDFTNMNLESHASCARDSLKVYIGDVLYSNRAFCGTDLPRDFDTSNPTVRLEFTTDFSVTSTGFRIQWTTSDGCGADTFTCWSGDCVPTTQKCDNIRQCFDDSDEIECSQTVSSDGECGKVAAVPQFFWDLRIVGGNDALEGSWPWQVQLRIGSSLCGGSIVNNNWVVTAAHCTINALTSSITVRAGILATSQVTGFQSVGVTRIINHPSYSTVTFENDISLLELATALTYSTSVRPICLPDDSTTFEIPTGTNCIATGWGDLASGYGLPTTLQQVRVPIVDQTQCSNAYGDILETHICAGDFTNGGVDSCQGDSGGPLVCYIHEAQWYLIGVTSRGAGCARAGFPGIYTRVSKFATWITDNTGTSPAPTPEPPSTIVFTTTTASNVYNDECGSNVVLTAASGSVASPGYPSNYGFSLSCVWTIQTIASKVIEVEFVHLDVESHTTCSFDHLKVFDGTVQYTGVNFCGTTEPKDFAASSTSVRIEFVSDSSYSRAGFLIRWQTRDRCNGTDFMCWNGDCIPGGSHCDGTRHCSDDSDEITCVQTPATNDECGKVLTAPSFTWDPRVVGGNEAASGSWPWQAALLSLSGTTPFCGGSIIRANWVLTAAHCVEDRTSTSFFFSSSPDVKVEVGKHFREGAASQSSDVSVVCVHSSYESSTDGNDIALLKLSTSLVYDDLVRPVCIPTPNHEVDSTNMAIATGWGTLKSSGDAPSSLYQVRLPIVGVSSCNAAYSSFDITASQVCAGDMVNGGVDTCQGDSGGPLVSLSSESSWYVLGITSYGTGCAVASSPGVYTRVSSYKSWIDDTIDANSGGRVVGSGYHTMLFTVIMTLILSANTL